MSLTTATGSDCMVSLSPNSRPKRIGTRNVSKYTSDFVVPDGVVLVWRPSWQRHSCGTPAQHRADTDHRGGLNRWHGSQLLHHLTLKLLGTVRCVFHQTRAHSHERHVPCFIVPAGKRLYALVASNVDVANSATATPAWTARSQRLADQRADVDRKSDGRAGCKAARIAGRR